MEIRPLVYLQANGVKLQSIKIKRIEIFTPFVLFVLFKMVCLNLITKVIELLDIVSLAHRFLLRFHRLLGELELQAV